MHDLYETLEELCEKVSKELGKANEKLGGNMSAGDVEYVDKLTHTLKSIKTTLAMIDAEDGYSNAPYRGDMTGRGTYGTSRARGRMNAPRDSRGRYSGRRYSMDSGDMVEELRGLMADAPDERTRHEFQSFINRLESM